MGRPVRVAVSPSGSSSGGTPRPETDDDGRLEVLDRVAVVAVVGNEHGAHEISGDLFQALDDVGFTLPAQAAT